VEASEGQEQNRGKSGDATGGFTPPAEERRLKSATACFASAWASDVDPSVVDHTVERWRRGGIR